MIGPATSIERMLLVLAEDRAVRPRTDQKPADPALLVGFRLQRHTDREDAVRDAADLILAGIRIEVLQPFGDRVRPKFPAMPATSSVEQHCEARRSNAVFDAPQGFVEQFVQRARFREARERTPAGRREA